MKRIKKITAVVLMCFSAVFIVMCGVTIGIGTGSNEVSKISYQEANYKNSNDALLAEVKKVQDVIKKNKDEGNLSGYSVAELVSQYFRHERYNSGIWNSYVPIQGGLVETVESEVSVNLKLDDESAKLYDLETGKEIDFIHMLATLELYLTCNSNALCSMAGISDFGGWAGDLAELGVQVADLRLSGTTDSVLLQKYSDSMLGTNKDGSSFSSADILADLDALVLFRDYTDSGIMDDLYSVLMDYYVTLECGVNCYNTTNRIESAKYYMGDPKTKATTLMGLNGTLGIVLGTEKAAKISAGDKEIIVNSFEKYMNEVPYIEFNSTSSTQVVGETKVVKVIESNLVDEVVEVEPNIAYVTKSGYEYSITPFKAGEATIKISSKDKSVSATYSLTAKNVVPTIKSNLLDSYDLTTKNKKEISFEVEGTNNVYTWYISDKIDGEYKVLTTTTEPRFNIDPKLELNGKYIKCGIKNEGNAEVFTKATKLNVSESTVVDTGDLTIPFMIAIIVLILLANLIYQRYVKTRPITNLIVK